MVIKEVQEKVNWVDYMDSKEMGVMLKEEGDVLAIIIKEPSDPFTFIVLAVGQLNNWTWVGFSKNMGNEFCNASLDVLFNIFNNMNFYLAQFDVSHNIEILHLNNSNEFENEVNKKLEKKIELVEPTFETLNLGCGHNVRCLGSMPWLSGSGWRNKESPPSFMVQEP